MEKKDLQVINYNIYIKLSNAIYICIFIGKKRKKNNIKATVEIKIDDDVIDHRKDGMGCQMLISIFLP
jgi:hypothetical protein